jgi:two-component system nitrogen regulation response regulator GlnG
VAQILLVNDDLGSMTEQVRGAISLDHRVEVACPGAGCLEQIAADPPEVILLDCPLADRTGFAVFDAVRGAAPRTPIIFLAHSTAADHAIEAMKRGAFDYLFEPLDPAELQRTVDEALEVASRLREPVPHSVPVSDEDISGTIIGACPAMREVYKAIGRVAARDVPVLITGESGTGKELVARAVHQHSRRTGSPFSALNCAAVPENLLESELFGHEKGAFTGADRRRVGRFEQCHGGTLFLDEIGDMPAALQAKMLRVLQEQSFERVGGGETIATDVRIISATHRDLKARSVDGTFRADLYYRLGVFTVHLPPLRDRADDLPLLVRYFLLRFGSELGRDVRDICPIALARLRQYSWPGNLRELQSVLKQALLRTTGSTLLPSALPALAERIVPAEPEKVSRDELNHFVRRRVTDGSENLLEEARLELDRVLLPLVMELTRGNQLRAARVLGVARQTLRRRLRELNIAPRFALEAVS